MIKSFEAIEIGSRSNESDEPQLLDHKGFLAARKRFQEFQTRLRKVEEHFARNFEIIDLWQNREKTRQAGRPRWSFNDESRYRVEIVKATADNDRLIKRFKSHQNNISSLIESTAKDLELIRGYLDIMQASIDARNSEDIKRFTYVTVVFLPLGFATGMFSMSEAPTGPTLVNMIITAIATLTITLLTLVGYKFADSRRSRRDLTEAWTSSRIMMLMKLVLLRTGLMTLVRRLEDWLSKRLEQKTDEQSKLQECPKQAEEKYESSKTQIDGYPRGEGIESPEFETLANSNRWGWGSFRRRFGKRKTTDIEESRPT